MSGDSQGAIYAAFIEEQLNAEHSRRESLADRAVRLQQSAGILLGLFATALGFVVGQGQHPAPVSLVLFGLMAVLLTVAAGFSVAVTRPIDYDVADQAFMRNMVDAHWSDSEVDSRNITAWANMNTALSMRPGNNKKADYLALGVGFQAAGVFIGALTILVTVACSLGASSTPSPLVSGSPTASATATHSLAPRTPTPNETASALQTPE